jgi:hypothetical protein
MKPRLPLFTKVLFVAFLNLVLLCAAVALIARAQFRVDPGSFLLAPAQSRITAVAQALAFELEDAEPGAWDHLLAQYADNYRAKFVLFDETGQRVAGPDLQLPREVTERIPRRRPPRQGPPPPGGRGDEERPAEPDRRPRPPSPPLFLTATSAPTAYWAGARVPVRHEPDRNPHPGTLLMTSPSLLASPLFFDFRPWLTIGLAVMDGDITTAGSQGLWADCDILDFSREEPLDGAMIVKVTAKPTYTTNAPQWKTIAAA